MRWGAIRHTRLGACPYDAAVVDELGARQHAATGQRVAYDSGPPGREVRRLATARGRAVVPPRAPGAGAAAARGRRGGWAALRGLRRGDGRVAARGDRGVAQRGAARPRGAGGPSRARRGPRAGPRRPSSTPWWPQRRGAARRLRRDDAGAGLRSAPHRAIPAARRSLASQRRLRPRRGVALGADRLHRALRRGDGRGAHRRSTPSFCAPPLATRQTDRPTRASSPTSSRRPWPGRSSAPRTSPR